MAVNAEPFTVRVKAAPPAWAVEGARLVMVGVGTAVIVKADPLEVAPFALTVMVAVAGEVIRAASTEAVNLPAFTKVVGSGVSFHRTVELAVNAEPFTVRVKAAPPACAVDGLKLVIVGVGGAVIVNGDPLEVTPFALTVTVAAPAEAMRLAATDAVSLPVLTKAVGSGVSFHRMVELAVNAEPFTVKVKAAPPACAVAGARLVMVGLGAAVMVKADPLEVTPFALTVTVAVPTEVMRLAATDAVSLPAFAKLVGNGASFHRTVELAANAEPFTVRVKAAPPACAVDGARLVIVGVGGAVMVKAEPLEVSPFALTVTMAVPTEVMRLAPTDAVSLPAFTKLVGSGVSFHRTVELAANAEPFTVRVKAAPPACAVDGARLVIVGVCGAVMVKTAPLEMNPFALTVTAPVPGETIQVAATEAVN